MKLQFAIRAIAVLAFATGCQEATTQETTQTSFKISEPMAVTYSAPGSYVVPNGDTKADAERYFEVVAEPLFGVIQSYKTGAISSDEFDEQARDIIASAKEEAFYPSAAQEVSHNALRYLMQDENADPDAIAWHTDMLIKHRSPHADAISEALEALEGHWTDEEINKASEETVANAEAWLVSTDEREHMPEGARHVISTAVKEMSQ